MKKLNKDILKQLIKEEIDNVLNEKFDPQTGKSLSGNADLQLMKIDADLVEYSREQLKELARRFFGLQGEKVAGRVTGNTKRQIDEFVPKLATALQAMTEFHAYIKMLEEGKL